MGRRWPHTCMASRVFICELDIIVISGDGWSWLLGLAQLGVRKLRVLAVSDLAVKQLGTVMGVLGVSIVVEVADDLAQDLSDNTVWCMHFVEEIQVVMAATLSNALDSCKVLITCHPHSMPSL